MILSSDPCFRNTFPENNYKMFIKNFKSSISKVEINLFAEYSHFDLLTGASH